MIWSKKIKNYTILLVYIISMLLVIVGAILKLRHNEYSNIVLSFGLGIQLQALLMLIYKYGYDIRKTLSK